MMDRKSALTAEVTTRRQSLENKKQQLSGATARFKQTSHASDGETVARLAGEVRLAEIALDGVQEALRAELEPKRVQVTSSRVALLQQRAQIVQRRDWRHQQHQLQVDQERQRCGYTNEQHVQAHLRNVLGPGDLQRRRADEQDERELASISAQLAELDRCDGQSAPLGAA